MTSPGKSDEGLVRAFGPWRFDAGTGDLSDGSTTVRLEPQVARVLDYFLSRQGTLVSRDDLIAAAWDDRIVSDDAINRCISILRQRLTPHDRNAFIETVVRRGFISHFPPPHEAMPASQDATGVEPPGTGPGATQGRARRRGRFAVTALAAAIASLAFFAALRLFDDAPAPAGASAPGGTPMVAVLPFVSAGLAAETDFFARGMHDDLLTQLAQLESIRVISRTSVAEYRDVERNIREIGRELGADAILEGGVQRIGDQIRINVQLIDAHDDAHLWAQQYDRALTPTNIFGVQSEIARAIAKAMDSTLSARDAAQLEVLPTANMAAYRAYHEAMELRETRAIGTPAYIANLERAVALDPEFVRAWAELAGSLSYANFARRDPDSIRRLESVLERIRTLAPQSSEHLIAQSFYTYYVLKDYDRAFDLIEAARSMRPSDPQLLELKSWIQRRQGDFEGAIETIRQGQTLDPRSAYWTLRLVHNLAFVHRYGEAVEELEKAAHQSIRLSMMRSKLRVRDHGDLSRMLGDFRKLPLEYGEEVGTFHLWEAHIAARDYAGAAALLDGAQEIPDPDEAWSAYDVPNIDLARLISWRLGGTRHDADSSLAASRARLVRQHAPGAADFRSETYIAMALLAAVEGRRDEAARLLRTWERETAQDLAELVIMRHWGCRALGLAAAAPEAVQCLRMALMEPSRAMRFIEPFLPYYDPIRDDPRFVAFFAETSRL